MVQGGRGRQKGHQETQLLCQEMIKVKRDSAHKGASSVLSGRNKRPRSGPLLTFPLGRQVGHAAATPSQLWCELLRDRELLDATLPAPLLTW